MNLYYNVYTKWSIPVAAPIASKRPTIRNGAFGTDNISSVTMPARHRIYKIEKYTITYLKKKKIISV
jgi:hypothetical protein